MRKKDNISQIFFSCIKSLCDKNGWNYKDLAKHAKVSPRQAEYMLKGERAPRIDRMQEIIYNLGLPLEEGLLGRRPSPLNFDALTEAIEQVEKALESWEGDRPKAKVVADLVSLAYKEACEGHRIKISDNIIQFAINR